MKNKILKICNLIAIVVLSSLLVLFALVDVYSVKLVNAATSQEVISDLRKDKSFDENNYPYVKDDYGLYVIQIAESENKELFVYAYQPCHDTYDLVGTKISISYGYSVDGSGLKPQLYNLQLISTSGTLDKYYVQGFTVPNDGDRYYNIVEIFRMANSEIDNIDPSFPKTDIAYSVGQQWYCCDLNKSKHYEMNTFDTLFVETVFNGNINFPDGFKLGNLVGISGSADCWFYCFNQDDYIIKHIFDADLNYSIRSVKDRYSAGSNNHTLEYFNERLNQILRLKDTDVMTYSGGGLRSRSYEWNRILSSSEFIKIAEEQKVTFSVEQKEKINASQWVFTYLETERTHDRYGSSMSGGVYYIDNYSDLYDVGLLRLHFQDITGKYYDIGVVNDLTDPDNIADGHGSLKSLSEMLEEFFEKLLKLILLIIGIVLLILILRFYPPVRDLLKFVWKAIKTVISAPFKLLKKIFKKGG